MKVYEVKPYGYCAGVLLALRKAYEAKRNRPNRRVYLLGMLVHNEETIELLQNAGLILLDERKEDLESQLRKLGKGDSVIFSAHGHPAIYDEIARENKVEIIDATCPFVKENEAEAKKLLKEKEEIIYLGVKGHLESEGFRANVKEACFYDVHSHEFDKDKIQGDSPIALSQTTLSETEIDSSLTYLSSFYPTLRKGKLRCDATSARQKAMKELPEGIDTVIVLGSNSSNNSLKLYEIALKSKKKAYLALNLDAVKALDLSSSCYLALATGASTSLETYLAVKDYLLSL